MEFDALVSATEGPVHKSHGSSPRLRSQVDFGTGTQNNIGSSTAWATTYHLIQFKDWDARYANILFWAATRGFKMQRLHDNSGYYYEYSNLSLPSEPVLVGTSAR